MKRLFELGLDDYLGLPSSLGAELHTFEPSPPISTYIYGLFAGKFKTFTYTGSDVGVPMRLYASQSKAGYLDADEMFRVTAIGIRFYERFFGPKFPFAKYDQIFVPEFRIGGMENAGAVAYNDVFLKPQEEMTDSLRFRLAYITLHELAHMWFGDLVTMKWWNDLWLKESFADFSALMCLMECKSELTVEGLKSHIYGTHPIQVEVKHTIDAVNVFDDICYEKGACFIKTLKNFIGREALSEGVRAYFEKFGF
jgi:aminopeptidase N